MPSGCVNSRGNINKGHAKQQPRSQRPLPAASSRSISAVVSARVLFIFQLPAITGFSRFYSYRLLLFMITYRKPRTVYALCRIIHYLSLSAAMPGSSLPSRNSREAPPPVEIWVILSPKPSVLTAAAESPPPIMVIRRRYQPALLQLQSCLFARIGFSNTPIGPFQTTVFADLHFVCEKLRGSRSNIKTHRSLPESASAVNSLHVDLCVYRVREMPSATSQSTGSRILTPFSSRLFEHVAAVVDLLVVKQRSTYCRSPLRLRKV